MFKLRKEQNGQNKIRDRKRILFLFLFSILRLCWMMALEARQGYSDSENYQLCCDCLPGALGCHRDTGQRTQRYTFVSWPWKMAGLGKLLSSTSCFLALSFRQSITRCKLLWNILYYLFIKVDTWHFKIPS